MKNLRRIKEVGYPDIFKVNNNVGGAGRVTGCTDVPVNWTDIRSRKVQIRNRSRDPASTGVYRSRM